MEKKHPYGIFQTKEQMEAYREYLAQHEKKMETDPEYRERWEKELMFIKRHFPTHVDEE